MDGVTNRVPLSSRLTVVKYFLLCPSPSNFTEGFSRITVRPDPESGGLTMGERRNKVVGPEVLGRGISSPLVK